MGRWVGSYVCVCVSAYIHTYMHTYLRTDRQSKESDSGAASHDSCTNDISSLVRTRSLNLKRASPM